MAEREVQAPSSGQSLWGTWHPNPRATKLACPLPAQLSLTVSNLCSHPTHPVASPSQYPSHTVYVSSKIFIYI